MKKYCNINEFYENSKDLDFLKTETIALFFFLLKEQYLKDEYFRVSNIKGIVQDFLNGESIQEENYHYTSLYLNYLKGVKNIWKYKDEIKRVLLKIKKILNFYENSKDLDFLKTETIALFFFLLKEQYLKDEYFRVSNIKGIVQDFLNGESIQEENYHYTSLYLNYLKGVKNIWKYKDEIKRVLLKIKKILN